ncbi:MAG TPA: hypothetical protein VH208_10495 [Myxococcaceae bacterium]|nr:hypothetical protein [Myxococcaceae bacterium]
MNPMIDPPRLLDEPGAPQALRSALRAGRDDLPSDDTLKKLAAGLVVTPLVGASAAKAAGLVGKGISLKLASAVVVAAVAGGGAVVVIRSRAVTAPPEVPAPVVRVHRAPAEPPPEPPPEVEPPPPAPPLRGHRAVAPLPPVPATPQVNEVELVHQAQDMLGDNPRAALSLAEKHRQLFPDGTFAQEREVIAIDALVRLRRTTDAAERARRFEESFPGSAHLPRVHALVQKNPLAPPLNGSNGP